MLYPYLKFDVKLIKLKDSKKIYIYVGKTNGAQMNGFYLYELRDNKIELLDGGTNPTGVGEVKLTATATNGVFDGFTDKQLSYDVLYVPVFSHYTFNGKTFDLNSVDVSLPKLPVEPEDVLYQFVQLELLVSRIDPSSQPAQSSIQERLEQLSSGLQTSSDELAELQDFIIVEDPKKTKKSRVNDNQIAFSIDYADKTKKVTFEFQLVKDHDHWLVHSVKRLET
jgi:hypothetical protein